MATTSMQPGLGRLSVSRCRKGRDRASSSNAGEAGACRLNGHGLAHDGASARKGLQLRDGSATGGGRDGRTGSRRHGPEAGGGGLLHEGAHGLGLAKDGVHGGCCVFLVGGEYNSLQYVGIQHQKKVNSDKNQIQIEIGPT